MILSPCFLSSWMIRVFCGVFYEDTKKISWTWKIIHIRIGIEKQFSRFLREILGNYIRELIEYKILIQSGYPVIFLETKWL